MKTARVDELTGSFDRISEWLEAGETVELTKQGRPYARIVPTANGKASAPDSSLPKMDFAKRARELFGEVMVRESDVEAVLDEARQD